MLAARVRERKIGANTLESKRFRNDHRKGAAANFAGAVP
jgi:hypothetical protein